MRANMRNPLSDFQMLGISPLEDSDLDVLELGRLLASASNQNSKRYRYEASLSALKMEGMSWVDR